MSTNAGYFLRFALDLLVTPLNCTFLGCVPVLQAQESAGEQIPRWLLDTIRFDKPQWRVWEGNTAWVLGGGTSPLEYDC